MSRPSYSQKHYASAQKRLLPAAIAHFFDVNFPKFFGPDMRERIAQALMNLIEVQFPVSSHLRPGQCLWNAVAIDTRADSVKLRLVPVVLTLVDEADVTRLAAGEKIACVAQDTTARLLDEAFQQGALLSMRDIGLLTWRKDATISQWRQAWERENHRQLPHPGNLQDMGTCISHKTAIVVKAIYEHQDPRRVAADTKHTQQAVDRYLRDFQRVRTCYRKHPELTFICQVTGMSKHLVEQYISLIENNEKTPLTGKAA
jgi:hypothetical protein